MEPPVRLELTTPSLPWKCVSKRWVLVAALEKQHKQSYHRCNLLNKICL